MIKMWRKMQEAYGLLPMAMVLLMVFYPFAANLFASNAELLDNRPLYQKPTRFSRTFAQEFENYYNDTFAGRKKLIKKLTKLKIKWGLDSGTTINGRDGWLFYDSGKVPDGYSLIDYFGKVRFSENELRQMAEGLKAAQAYYQRRGMDYYLIIAPNKEGMYSEFMPDNLQKSREGRSRMDLAVEYLQKHTNVKIINYRGVLEKHKETFGVNLYYPSDSHWNEVGAYLGWQELAESFRDNGVKNVPVRLLQMAMIHENGNFASDLGSVVAQHDRSYKIDYLNDQKPKNLVTEEGRFFEVWENPQAPVKKTVLMIRDSFGLAMMPYMEKTFAKTVFAHNKYNKRNELDQLMAEYKPDIMVDEMVERYFDRLLKYNELYGE